MPKVIYLGDGSPYSLDALKFLLQLVGVGGIVYLDQHGGLFPGRFPEYDIAFNFLAQKRIPKREFAIPYKWVNFHPAPLPEYGGRNVAYHAMMNKEKEFGATVHYMNEDFDTGEIIEVARFPIEEKDTAGDLVKKSHKSLLSLFRKWVPFLLLGKVDSTKQTNTRYFPKQVIDSQIQLTPEQTQQVKALSVHPRFHAFVMVGGRKYKLIPESYLAS